MTLLSSLGFILSLSISIMATPAISWLARRLGLLDRPNRRKVHTNPTPRLGGVGVGLSTFLTLSVLFALPTPVLEAELREHHQPTVFFGILITWCGILILGILDDLKGFSAVTKFKVQLVLASTLFLFGFRVLDLLNVQTGYNGWWFILDWAVTTAWMIGISNALNLIDGMDGLAGSTTALTLTAIVILSLMMGDSLLAMASLVLLGATLGFLHWNRPPALLFLGDSGSLSLGWFLAIGSVLASSPIENPLVWVFPLFLLGYPITDVFLAIYRRLRTGPSRRSWYRRILLPDKNHIHHRLLLTGYSPSSTLWTLNSLTGFFIASGFFVYWMDSSALQWVASILTVLVIGWAVRTFFYEPTPNPFLAEDDQSARHILVFGWDSNTPREADRARSTLSYPTRIAGHLLESTRRVHERVSADTESANRAESSTSTCDDLPVLGSFWDLYRIHRSHPVDAIFVGAGVRRMENLYILRQLAEGMDIPVVHLHGPAE